MREFFIKDLALRNNIDKIKHRPVNDKTSLLKPINIYPIKKPSSPRPISKIPIKTFIPILNVGNLPVKTSPALMKSKNKFNNFSVSKFNYQHGITANETEKKYRTHRNFVNDFLEAKRRDSMSKSILIEKQNEKFGLKLNRISSPLSKNRLNESYSKSKNYGNIAKKIKPDVQKNIKKINYVKSHLPPLLIKGHTNKRFNMFSL
jgi:hypothetical protein